MNKFVIDELYIFSLSEKLAKKVLFKDGCNIVTSNKEDGNDRGKSTIIKSLYYTLGADVSFATAWNRIPKIYALKIDINNIKYYILRNDKLFTICNSKCIKIFTTGNRKQLALFFKEKFGFYIFLKEKKSKEYELTPPVFNYLINFSDQTKMNCTELKSFERLTQYDNYKSDILWQYFGVYNEEYFNIKKEKEKLEKVNKKLIEEIKFKDVFIQQLQKNINYQDYSTSYDNLLVDIEKSKDEYLNISNKLNKLKKKLISFRNEKEDILIKIKEINNNEKIIDKQIKEGNNSLEQFNIIGEFIFLKQEFENSILKLERKIQLEENKYKEQLKLLNEYEDKMNLNELEVNNAMKYYAINLLKEQLVNEIKEKSDLIKSNKKLINEITKKEKAFKAKKDDINKRYKELMTIDKKRLNLDTIITNEKIEEITNDYIVDGSNIPIATMLYYMNLIQIRNEFNKDLIKLPIVIDSPNNTESDMKKERALYEYIFEKMSNDNQWIMSGIGINQSDFKNIKFDNMIILENEKYRLLNHKDFSDNIELLYKLT